MAARTLVQMLDDLDGTEATHTIRFSVDGRNYEIDLNDKHEQQFRKALEKWVANARRVNSAHRRQSRPNPEDTALRREIREWARENGYDCPVKGRIPQAVIDAWNAAP